MPFTNASRTRRAEQRRGRHAGRIGMWRMAQELRAAHSDHIVLFARRIGHGQVAALSGIPDRSRYGYRRLQRVFLSKGPFTQANTGPSAAYPEASAFAVAHGFADQWLLAMGEPLKENLPRPMYAPAMGTSEAHKKWGETHYAQLTEGLTQGGTGVVILDGHAEREIVQNSIAQVDPACHNHLVAITDAGVYGSAAILKQADACVGNDTVRTTYVNAPSLRALTVSQVVGRKNDDTNASKNQLLPSTTQQEYNHPSALEVCFVPIIGNNMRGSGRGCQLT